MVLLRRIVFYLFVVIYLITCPLTILYAFGIIFTPDSQQGVIRTGLISISSLPSGARVYLDSQAVGAHSPTVIPDLRPGDYRVKLVLRGHRPWTKQIRVAPGRAAVLEDVLLLPRRRIRHASLPPLIQQLIPIPRGTAVVAVLGRQGQDLVTYDTLREQAGPLVPLGSPWERAVLVSSWTMPGSSALLLRLQEWGRSTYVWSVPARRRHIPEDLSRLFLAPPEQVVWDPNQPEVLWSLYDQGVDRMDRRSMEVSPRFIEGVRGVGLHAGHLYALTTTHQLLRCNVRGERWQALDPELLPPREAFPGGDTPVILTVVSERLIFFTTPQGAVWSSVSTERLINADAEELVPDSRGDQVLIRQPTRLGILDLARLTGKPDGEGPLIRWIVDRRERIRQAFWVGGNCIAFRDGNHLYLAQQWQAGEPDVIELARLRPGSRVAWLEETGRLYFLDGRTNHLVSLDVLPRFHLLTRFLPDRQRLVSAVAGE